MRQLTSNRSASLPLSTLFAAVVSLSLLLAGCEKNPPTILPADQQQGISDGDDSILPEDPDDPTHDGDEDDCFDDLFEGCEEELAAADACWESAESDEELEACWVLEDELMECAFGDEDDWGDDDDDDWEIPEECEPALEAADTCWEAAETDDDFDACWVLEEELMECLGIDLDDPVEAY